jgi:hypothetical protein
MRDSNPGWINLLGQALEAIAARTCLTTGIAAQAAIKLPGPEFQALSRRELRDLEDICPRLSWVAGLLRLPDQRIVEERFSFATSSAVAHLIGAVLHTWTGYADDEHLLAFDLVFVD